jgi:purine-binding chemotaxis protein CheW
MTTATAAKYLTFALGNEEYAVGVLKVREIIKMMDITAVPQVPPYVKGVVNLRGRVIPVVDLRLKFGLPAVEYSERTCIVVVEPGLQDGAALMGLIVDAVSDVLTIATDDLTDAADVCGSKESGYVESLARVKGRVKILLNIDRLLLSDGGNFARAAQLS